MGLAAALEVNHANNPDTTVHREEEEIPQDQSNAAENRRRDAARSCPCSR